MTYKSWPDAKVVLEGQIFEVSLGSQGLEGRIRAMQSDPPLTPVCPPPTPVGRGPTGGSGRPIRRERIALEFDGHPHRCLNRDRSGITAPHARVTPFWFFCWQSAVSSCSQFVSLADGPSSSTRCATW